MDPWGISTGRFRRSDRLLSSRDFRRVLRNGRRFSHRDFLVVVAEGREKTILPRGLVGVEGARLGITASRKVGNAVYRNRLKRRVREWFRRRQGEIREIRGEVDLVVIARRSAAGLSQAEIDQRLSRLLGLLPNGEKL